MPELDASLKYEFQTSKMSLEVFNKESVNEEASYFKIDVEKNTRLLSLQNPFLDPQEINSEMLVP